MLWLGYGYVMAAATGTAVARREAVLWLPCQSGDSNLSAVTVAPWVSFQALNWCLAYPGFSEQCELYEWQENWHHKQDQQDTSSQRSNSIANILKRLLQTSQLSSVQLLSRVPLFGTPWIAAHQASLSITNSRSSLRLVSIESEMPSSHLILCRPLLLQPPIPPSIRVFSNESILHMRWPKTGVSALASFLPNKSQGCSPSEWTGWISFRWNLFPG